MVKSIEEILCKLVDWHYVEGGWDENDVPLGVPEAKADLYQLMLSLVNSLEYNSKLSRSYFQPTINSQKNHKNGYRLAVRELKAKLSEHFNVEGE